MEELDSHCKVGKMILTLSNDASKQMPVDATEKQLNISERARASVKRVSLFLGLAFLSLFVPVFHFVLVPTFLLIAFVFGIIQFKEKIILVPKQKLLCLKCEANLNCESLSLGKAIECQKCLARHILHD